MGISRKIRENKLKWFERRNNKCVKRRNNKGIFSRIDEDLAQDRK